MAEAEPAAERRERDADDDVQSVEFTAAGFREGFVTGFPVAVGVAGYGVVFGVVARRAGLSVAEAAVMSATVVAGAAQLVAVELWADPIPVVAVVSTTLLVNLRYVLMGAALRPWLGQLDPLEAYGSVFFFADENWALSIGALRSGSRNGAFLFGSGVVLWLLWIASTAVGATAGDLVGDPATYGLDFVATALFLTLAAGFWGGKESLRPWVAAAAAALATNAVVPGEWYILVGALAGAAAEVVTYED
ncbi:AzlC family ABC transporter permease [Halobacterium sp. R2-5]|uniref:AzlC family ABC transporter permease n=1 Tax=Halobacterium sp. R2-5 TaxID=2715751 RepID=UPI00141FA264|nr:AzlC family ABC transporter permease [Halobacterium sp. R2-5]NIB98862.1 AzlC family ABC transporter permease [Halobacterium sp. R2-5]